ncbi:ABC transporter permease [Streptococcus saliviloxodontae]|uniref:ABC transport system permease protein n=1 Tax=Streptococcus saliviloxodontae TaxID=1349416 RepID=A0ABS2PM97_9STRE|nr:ABC transporter permease [Streptococcus saliviloxodontae]MBM7636562.1 putative ABC transport system permease protein [Streptococcus saliviloxodontae]
MNFIKRAWLVTKVKKGRTLLLTLVTSAILIFVLAGLTIKNAADSAVSSAKSTAGASVVLSVNREAMMKNRSNQDSSSSSSADSSSSSTAVTGVALSTAKKIAEKDGVASYFFTSTTMATVGTGISPISSTSTTSSSSSDNNSDQSGPGPGGMSGDFTITGVNDSSLASDFASSINKITSGTGISSDTADNSALISSDLAEANNLSIGDSFTVTTTVNSTTVTTTLKVVGIYSSSSSATTAQMMSNASNPQNNIYTTVATANTMKGTTDTLDSAVYQLSNPEKLSTFAKEVTSSVDSDTYSVTTSDEVYQQMLAPLNNISSIAKNIVILVAVAGAAILTLIVILSIRERRYEIGVLMSLGENRLKIIGQFFTELLMVTVVSLLVTGFAGNFVGNALGNQLLSSSTSNGQPAQMAKANDSASNNDNSNAPTPPSGDQGADSGQKTSAPPTGGGGPGGANTMQLLTQGSQKIDDLKIKLTSGDVAKLGGIALLISFVSTLLASIGILRLKPKDILSSR